MRYILSTMTGVLLLIFGAARAQDDDYHYPGYGYFDGEYAYEYHSSTAGEGYGRGVADVIRSQGLYNQLSAEAAVGLEEARRRRIENYQKRWPPTLRCGTKTGHAVPESATNGVTKSSNGCNSGSPRQLLG